ncbi:hypothetical protein CEXT_465561 [Caerostris extrusa]|uniref:Uncharacterized protein n=1 Tax=Caerostris extrusa TaxID=172846 RepID=A0AAV4NQX0_CAEEX|nr:hypothetical protein CEXT_465561 [Caerostris extrusa]
MSRVAMSFTDFRIVWMKMGHPILNEPPFFKRGIPNTCFLTPYCNHIISIWVSITSVELPSDITSVNALRNPEEKMHPSSIIRAHPSIWNADIILLDDDSNDPQSSTIRPPSLKS